MSLINRSGLAHPGLTGQSGPIGQLCAYYARVIHLGFIDESCWNRGRYRAVGMVSVPVAHLGTIESALRPSRLLGKLAEWKNARPNSYESMLYLLSGAVHFAALRQLRVDVLCWDTHDSRHNVSGRDDAENLKRMMYRVAHHGIRCWGAPARWLLVIDRSDIAESYCGKLTELLNNKLSPNIQIHGALLGDAIKNLFLLLADIFAGIGCFSWLNASSYNRTGLSSMPGRPQSRTETRFRLLFELERIAAMRGFEFDVARHGGLLTRDPRSNINFWLYAPQGSYDRAPIRIRHRD